MKRAIRTVAVLGGLTVLVLAGYHVAASAQSVVASMQDDPEPPGMMERFRQIRAAALGSGYDLSSLKNLRRADSFVSQSYVDPERVDYDEMFRSAMQSVESVLPEVLLSVQEGGRRLHVEVNGYSTVLQVQELDDFTALEDELRRVASVLEEHLDPSEHDEEEEVSFEEIEYTMINGVLRTLDPHSIFLPPEGSKKMEEDNEGEFGGLGITIQMKDGGLTIEYPLEDTPAFKAGLLAQDRILKIDGEGTLNMDLDEAVSKMRGHPGTPVTLTIMRTSFETPKDFTIVRDTIKSAKVKSQLLEGGIGYVRIDSFHQQVEPQLDEALTKLQRDAGPNGLKGLVLDMRRNPGGFLHQAVAVVDKFLTHGTIVSTVERHGRNREQKEARETGTELPMIPMAVLMDGNSASASEIVAGALKNTERAVIIGERSFGKGSVQNLYPFADGSRLKLTVARYLTPGDHSIQSVGIPPDIALEQAWVRPPKEIEYEKGGQKQKVTTGPRVSLYGRDRIQREADLNGHLLSVEESGPPPVYSLRYLRDDPEDDEATARTDRQDLKKDFEVMLARDVLLAATGPRRPDVLRDAAAVVAQRAKAEGAKVEKAFASPGVGIDWTACQNPDHADVKVAMKLGEDGELDAGEKEKVRVEVTNLGQKPLCQVVAIARSGNDQLDGQEFYLGKIPAGETRGYDVLVGLADGYPDEESAAWLDIMDATRRVLATHTVPVIADGQPLPRYAWSYSTADGDGDGTIEVGETVRLKIDVLNVGEGTGGVARFVLKKGAGIGKSVELLQGDFEAPLLAPGARAAGEVSFKVLAQPADGKLPFELRVQDGERYDYASVVKAQFYGYFNEVEKLSFPVGSVGPAAHREPPSIEVTKAPGLTSAETQVTISGVVKDDVGVRDVVVYAVNPNNANGVQKIAYGGAAEGQTLKTIPFTATASLGEGENLLVVLTRDVDGLTTTRSVVVHRPVKEAPKAEVTPAEKRERAQ
ncbi:MAG: S41 family peptidase [Myxococcota bacterium]